MTEVNNSIVALERENASHNADLLATEALRLAGLENASADTLAIIGEQIPAVAELRQIQAHYNNGVNQILDHPDASQEDRESAYMELYETASKRFEEVQQRVAVEAKEARQRLNEKVFGVPGLGTGSGPQAGSTQSYRDAIFRLSNASSDELATAADIAETTGDTELLKAAALIADRRGDKAVLHRYLRRNEAAFDSYVRRQNLPVGVSLSALMNAYAPRAYERSEIRPSPIAKQRRKELERSRNARLSRSFGRR